MRRLGVGKGTDSLLSTNKRRRENQKKAEIRASYLLPASLVKDVKRLAIDRGVPAKRIAKEALEKFLLRK